MTLSMARKGAVADLLLCLVAVFAPWLLSTVVSFSGMSVFGLARSTTEALRIAFALPSLLLPAVAAVIFAILHVLRQDSLALQNSWVCASWFAFLVCGTTIIDSAILNGSGGLAYVLLWTVVSGYPLFAVLAGKYAWSRLPYPDTLRSSRRTHRLLGELRKV